MNAAGLNAQQDSSPSHNGKLPRFQENSGQKTIGKPVGVLARKQIVLFDCSFMIAGSSSRVKSVFRRGDNRSCEGGDENRSVFSNYLDGNGKPAALTE